VGLEIKIMITFSRTDPVNAFTPLYSASLAEAAQRFSGSTPGLYASSVPVFASTVGDRPGRALLPTTAIDTSRALIRKPSNSTHLAALAVSAASSD